MKYEVIIPAAGSGTRMGADTNKLLLELSGQTILEWTVHTFASDSNCQQIILPVKESEQAELERIFQGQPFADKVCFVAGGNERQFSVRNGLGAVSAATEIVLVHDGARPFIDRKQITSLVASAHEHGGSVLAVRVKDTIKKCADHFIVETIERESLWAIQTPQAFRLETLCVAHLWADENHFLGTDEASLLEKIGEPVAIVEGNYENIKLTTPEDLLFAEVILQKRMSKHV